MQRAGLARLRFWREAAALQCKREDSELSLIEANLAALRDFAKGAGCADVRALANAKIKGLEDEEKGCLAQDKNRNFLRDQAKGSSNHVKLADLLMRYGRDAKVFAFTDDVTANCSRKHTGSDSDPCGAIFPDLPKVPASFSPHS